MMISVAKASRLAAVAESNWFEEMVGLAYLGLEDSRRVGGSGWPCEIVLDIGSL